MRRSRVAAFAILAQVACSSSNGTTPPGTMLETDGGSSSSSSGSSSGGSSGSSSGQVGGDDAGAPGDDSGIAPGQDASSGDTDAAASDGSMGTLPDGGHGAADAGDAGDAGHVNTSIALTKLTANQAGRSGTDLVLTVTGTDPTMSAYGVDLQVEDSTGKTLAAFMDWSEKPITERVALFDGSSAAGMTQFTKTVTIPGLLYTFPNIAKVVAAITTSAGKSPAVTSSVVAQKLSPANQACDTAVVTSRCGGGYACEGSPTAVCTKAAAPQVTQLGYIDSPAGPRILAVGTDPADDISSLHLEFFDGQGAPVSIDFTGSGDFQTSFDLGIGGTSSHGTFFADVQTSTSWRTSVAQIAVTPSGSSSGAGGRVTASLTTEPTGMTGQACDLRGFSGCADGDSCYPTAPTTDVCMVTSEAMIAATAQATTLDPTVPGAVATGYTIPGALWGDPAQGCSTQGVHGFPEGIVLLHVPQDMATLTLSAAVNTETNFPSSMAVLNGTGASVTVDPLGCTGAATSVALTNVTAGDYTIVVYSRTTGGGEFAVTSQ